MGIRENLLQTIDAYRFASGLTETGFSLRATGSHKAITNLRAGKATLFTIELIEAFMAENPAEQVKAELKRVRLEHAARRMRARGSVEKRTDSGGAAA